ncbi:phospholipase A, partial [bacterium]|nr:phospholipase A [bacterium]
KDHSFTMMLRNNLRSDNRGAVEVGWSYPLKGRMKGYLQIFEGYGESLVDYDYRMTRVGMGILLADWL